MARVTILKPARVPMPFIGDAGEFAQEALGTRLCCLDPPRDPCPDGHR